MLLAMRNPFRKRRTSVPPVTPIQRSGQRFAALARKAASSAGQRAPTGQVTRDETLDIDHEECIGCGTCVENESTVFHLDDDQGKAFVIKQVGNGEAIEDAIDACPVACISWK
jgi:ferredoxin